MSEDCELILRQSRSALLLVLIFARDFEGFSRSSATEKLYHANHRKSGITEIQKGLFSWKFAHWFQAQAEDDELQLTAQSLAPPTRVLGAVWCRTTMKMGLKWKLSTCSLCSTDQQYSVVYTRHNGPLRNDGPVSMD